MKSASKHALSLSQQNAIRLALVFVLFEILVALAVVFFLLFPMARGAASDLAGLMVLSSQTWSELPPDTRPAFERELAASHGLFLATHPPAVAARTLKGGPYLRLLESELTRRAGTAVSLASTEKTGATWHWVGLPSGGRVLWVGFSHDRIGPQPAAAGLSTLAAGLVLAGFAAWWLARRTVAPLERFGLAAAALGRGETPELLPETGPRELAALARRFNALASQVRDLLDARTTLLAGLSHDLRTPLARMRLALEMMARRPDPAWTARLDQDIEEMNRLVGELLNLARGLGQEAAAQVDLADLLEGLAERARESGAEVRVRCPNLQLVVPPAALRRVLANLLANAQRYAGDNLVELRAEPGDGACRIGVLDRGPGIPEDQLEAVFRPFHRVESSRNPATGGTGLGLAIVRQLAQANGWRVWLENRPEGGLAAWVSVPHPPAEPHG
ncbi:MAG: HAMP domain-containing protein [Burkholderiaceae bacterium]|jgi:two-component system osmolarity sensor histidine kinase EnvZ|nr:HAMP domain-containing protein [Burkholderiaceae bacterium]